MHCCVWCGVHVCNMICLHVCGFIHLCKSVFHCFEKNEKLVENPLGRGWSGRWDEWFGGDTTCSSGDYFDRVGVGEECWGGRF